MTQPRAEIRRRVGQLVDLVFPPSCLLCEEPTAEPHGLCANCWRDTPFLAGRLCACCGAPAIEDEPGRPTGWTERRCPQCAAAPRLWRFARAAARYEGAARRLALQLKHGDRTAAARPMADWMARAAADLMSPRATLENMSLYLTPTPLHWRRRIGRRFNQSAELARRLSPRFDAPVVPFLRRRRATAPLQGMSVEERAATLRGVFEIAPSWRERLSGARVILVDDVLTSGATLTEATRVLQAAGAECVDVLVFARVAREAFDGALREPI